MKRSTNIIIWILSFIIMIASATYQRLTGPTYPMNGKTEINGKEIKFKLPRSHDGSGNELVKIEVPDESIRGQITLKRYKSYDDWTTQEMKRNGKYLVGDIPQQPPAGKVIYYVSLIKENGEKIRLNEEPAIIRFKGVVPKWLLIPHVIFMFFAMVLSVKTGLHAAFGGSNLYKYALWTTILFFIGGMILGPLVQKFAFDAYWTGWPFGHDLTDNKTLVALIFWLIAVFKLRKNPTNKTWPIIAAIVMLSVYLIPHSVLGSEIDYTKTPNP